jgi:hypothetical protein
MPRALWGVLWTLAVAVVLSGCFRSDQDRALTTEIGKSGLDLVSYTGTTRGAYIWPADGGRHVCAEPPPDLGLTTARELAANLKAAAEAIGGVGAPSLEAGGTAKLSSAAIELAGRSKIVLLAREFLYRECELAANFSKEDARYKLLAGQYEKILTVVQTLANAERDKSAAELIEARLTADALEKSLATKINAIVAAVSAPTGTLDRTKLTQLVGKAKVSDSVKAALLDETTPEGLKALLDNFGKATIDALVAAQG